MRIEIYRDWENRILEVLKKEESPVQITKLNLILKTSLPTTEKYVNIMEMKKLIKCEIKGRNRLVALR